VGVFFGTQHINMYKNMTNTNIYISLKTDHLSEESKSAQCNTICT